MFKFDMNNKVELPTFILRNKSLHNLGSIKGVQSFNTTFNLNSCQEFSCEIYKFENDVENPLWDKIKDNKIIYIPEFNEQYEIGVSIDDENATKKTITGKSLCEAELSQRILRDIEINTTDADVLRDDYQVSIFYNETNHKYSILHRILDKVPHYKIGYVSPTLRGISRIFSIDGTSIYDFMTGDLADEFDCLFQFDSLSRTINCYDLLNYCPECKKRFDSSESRYKLICPKCGNTKNIIKGYGDDTTVFISKDNLANSINLQTNKDNVKNMFKIIGGDDDVTTAVSYLTMNNGYIINITDDMKSDMSEALVKKVNEYNKKLKELEPEYASLTSQYYTALTKKLELEHSMSATVDIKNDSTAKKELDKIQITSIAFPNSVNPTLSIVENNIKSLAKLYINTGKFTLKLLDSSYSNNSWFGKIQIINLNNDKDIAISNRLNIIVNKDYETYVKQKIDKTLGKSEIKNIEYDWSQYALERLNGFQSAYQDVIDILIDMKAQALNNQNETEYNKIYKEYYDKLILIQKEIAIREKQIEKVKEDINNTLALMVEKQRLVDIKTFFGSDYVELCTYLLEDTYSNDNYVSAGLSDTGVLQRAKELIEVAKKECAKQSEINYTLSADINNLMAIKEFEPLWNKFKLGNWLRLEADKKIYRLRLISYSFDFSNLSKITVEFSDVRKSGDITTDTKSILEQASSLATTISYIQQRSQKNNAASLILDNWTQQGFIDTLGVVSDANNQSFIMDSHGFLGQKWNEFDNEYEPKKIKIINNGIYLTTDNFKTMKCGVGEFYYIDPITKQKIDAYGVIADTIVGKIILGEKVGIYNGNNSMSFNEDGLTITTNGIDDKKINAFTIQKQVNSNGTIQKMMYIDENGNICMGAGCNIAWDNINAPKISNISGLSQELLNIDTNMTNIISDLGELSADNKITPVEKIQLREKYQREIENYKAIVANYNDKSYIDHSSSPTDKKTLQIKDSKQYIDYYNFYSKIEEMCNEILNNMTETYDMSETDNYSKATYNNNWSNYYNSYQSLLNFLNNIVQSSASYAEELGDKLVEKLGYDGTKITGTYIYSPVIQGGYLLIGKKTNSHKDIYSEITNEGKLIAQACEIREQSTIAGFTFVKYKKYDNSAKKEIEIIGLENNTSQEKANIGMHSSGGWAIFAGTRSIFTDNPEIYDNIRGEYHLPHQFSVGHEGNVYCTNLFIGNKTPMFDNNGKLNVNATNKNNWTGGDLSVRGNGIFYKDVIIGNNTTPGSLHLIGNCYIGNNNKPTTISTIGTINIGNHDRYSDVNIIGNITIGNNTLETKPIINMFGSCNIFDTLTVEGKGVFKGDVHIGTNEAPQELHVNGDCTIGQNLDVLGSISIGSDTSPKSLNVIGNVNLGNVKNNSNVFITGSCTISNGLNIAGGITAFKGDVHIGTNEAPQELHVNGDCVISQNLGVAGNINVNSGHVAIKGSKAGRLALLSFNNPDTWVWINTGLVNNDNEHSIVMQNLRLDNNLYINYQNNYYNLYDFIKQVANGNL